MRLYGVVPLRLNNVWEVLLVRSLNGRYWGLPKGHSEPGESPQETAARELQEEAGLTVVRFLSTLSYLESYDYVRDGISVHNEVGYFPALVEGELALQPQEILEAEWLSLPEARVRATYPQMQAILEKVQEASFLWKVK